ncbi:MAG: ABC transporter ATP-binding protein [Parachlamydiales bacterium]|nr:ABC transporter ATP-binding protein [Parachlamydiales bacterium]
MKKILEVKNLNVEFSSNKNKVQALKGVSFDLFENEIISLVGESGSGKSVTALSILNLLDINAQITSGEIFLYGEDILKKSEKEFRKIRGKIISIIFQDPFSSLNPTMKIGKQILEAIKKAPSKQKVIELLKDVKIQNPELRYNQYPHQISGGQRQRVMIAIAIASKPKIIIADEITTSLDTTVQNEILNLLLEINKKHKTSIIFISHDLSLVYNFAKKIYVMNLGKIVEKGICKNVIKSPKHPYTKMLIDSIFTIENDKQPKNFKIDDFDLVNSFLHENNFEQAEK